MNTCPGYRTPATTMQPATESTHHLQREDTEVETMLYLNYDTYSYGCQTYATTMQPATESTHHLRREDRDRFCLLSKVRHVSGMLDTKATVMQPATESTRHLQRQRNRSTLRKYDTCPRCWALWRPSCNQPQKARTSYWKLKLELENYKDCSLVSVRTCLALSPC